MSKNTPNTTSATVVPAVPSTIPYRSPYGSPSYGSPLFSASSCSSSSSPTRPGTAGAGPASSAAGPGSRRHSSSSLPPTQIRRNSSFLDDGARDVLPPTECGFPLPRKGQTLCDFLSSCDFNLFMSPLDKENAHFYIAEAIIQAIEQAKCSKRTPAASNNDRVTSESEFERDPTPKTCPKPRRRHRRDPAQVVPASTEGTSAGSTEAVTGCSASLSPLSSDREGTEVDDDSRSDDSLESGESQAPMSAEGIALCLLRDFRDKPLPKASDLIWLVSENDVPQQLIPLPDCWPVSPDEGALVRTRGNALWAPPRKQIIFNKIFTEGSIKAALERQNYRCAGCGMKMHPKTSRPRLCHYLGKYFCQTCHHNDKSVIPARIVLKWDFTQCPVSDFASELLKSFYHDPVFELYEYSRSVFMKSRTLSRVTEVRGVLMKVAQYISKCKNANKTRLLRLPVHLYTDQYKYSLHDFVQARNGELLRVLLHTRDQCASHVGTCQLCRGQGFVCESCHQGEAIFPFDVHNVIQCTACYACFHRDCVGKQLFNCGKCERIRQRRASDTIYEGEEVKGN